MEFGGDDTPATPTPGPSSGPSTSQGLNPDLPPSMMVGGSPLDRILQASMARSQAKRDERRKEKGETVNF